MSDEFALARVVLPIFSHEAACLMLEWPSLPVSCCIYHELCISST